MKIAFGFVAMISTLMLMTFQNCAQDPNRAEIAQALSESNSDSPVEDTESLPPEDVTLLACTDCVFSVGEPFNYSKVANKSMMLGTFIQLDRYLTNQSGLKAIAISSSGLGYVARKFPTEIDPVTEEDIRRIALQGCFLVSAGESCALLAVGNQFVVDSETLNDPATFAYRIDDALLFEVEGLPFMPLITSRRVLAEYSALQNPKALAISIDGGFEYVSARDGVDLEEAKRVTLQRCELRSRNSLCLTAAINETLTFELNRNSFVSAVPWQQTTLSLPSIPSVAGTTARNRINAYIEAVKLLPGGNFSSLAISRNGRNMVAYSTVSQAEADSQAYVNCRDTESRPNVYTCATYSQGLNVVLDPRNIVRGYSYSKNIYCHATPRLSCAAHREAGCDMQISDQFYIVNDNAQMEHTVCRL